MNIIIDLFQNLWNLLACIGEVLGYLLRFVNAFFQTRVSLAAGEPFAAMFATRPSDMKALASS